MDSSLLTTFLKSFKNNRTALLGIGIILIGVLCYRLLLSQQNMLTDEKPIVNICDWYGMLTPDIIQEFEKETGIQVQHDVFDNNEVLEAKLLASNSGYDVVFPTASPYVMRQIHVGIYQKLNKELLSNFQDLNTLITKQMKEIDPELAYAIPFYWGTLGMLIDLDKVQKIDSSLELDSYNLIFNEKNLIKLKKVGVSFLEEAVDVIPLAQLYLGKDPQLETEKCLKEAVMHLKKLRPYIKRFTSTRFMNDVILGDIAVAQAWSGEAHQVKEEAKQMKRRIIYTIPKEGAILWIDCIAIPKGAPHPKNAHKLINFLMRPDIAARITNHTKIPTAMNKAQAFVDQAILNDRTIYPPLEVMQKLFMIKHDMTPKGLFFDRERTKLWTEIRLNR